MGKPDADGMIRVDLKWEIQGKAGTKSGKLYGLHFAERQTAEAAIKRRARRGDTIIIEEI